MRQNPHVRICGGPGSATTLVYPTASALGPHVGGRTEDPHATIGGMRCTTYDAPRRYRCVPSGGLVPRLDAPPLPAAPADVKACVVVGAVEAER